MKNFKKRDIAYIWICALTFLLLVFVLSNTMYLYGSQLDWNSEHIAFPDYFRTLFYNTKDLFPDFAFNLGNGQNIYNLSYYGLLSPIVLISYLLPSVNMYSYMMVATCLCVIIAMVLLYIFLKKKDFSSEVCFISSLIFILSSSLTLHSHRQIMFINYMPFLVMGLFGVDKKLHQSKSWLLALSVFLMIMTSYYYSIGGIITLIIYGIYEYLKTNKTFNLKDFLKTGLNFILPILIGVLASFIVILPTFATLINNRAASNITITLKDLLIPGMHIEYVIYDTYGVGLTAILIPSLINIITKKKEKRFLGIVLSLLIIFPIFNYILNGTMYIDSKSLIPFLVLYIIVIAQFIQDIFNNDIDYKKLIIILIIISIFAYFNNYKPLFYLLDIIVVLIAIVSYKLFEKKSIFIILIALISAISCYSMNKTDTLVLKYTTQANESEIKDYLNNIITNDNTFYRISNDQDIAVTVNNIYSNINYYSSTIYSSIQNQKYNTFYFDEINNNIPSRNRALTVTTNNIMSLMLFNNKYMISRNKPLQGYEELSTNNGISIYKNENVLPLGFATSNVSSYEDFENYNYATKEEAMLNMIVADVDSKNNFTSSTMKADINPDDIFNNKNITKNVDGSYDINALEPLKFTYKLPEKYQNKILFIRFNMNKEQTCSKGDLLIKINNVKNKLTCSSWKYHNRNYVFDYTLAEKDLDTLYISFTEGSYNISDVEIYYLDYQNIENVKDKLDAFEVDYNKTKGDTIEGNINVREDGMFMLTIPYDKGFNVLVDDQKVDYEMVDYSFIGFKIKEGNHHIKITYEAPTKKVAIIISIIGILSFIAIIILENKRTIK